MYLFTSTFFNIWIYLVRYLSLYSVYMYLSIHSFICALIYVFFLTSISSFLSIIIIIYWFMYFLIFFSFYNYYYLLIYAFSHLFLYMYINVSIHFESLYMYLFVPTICPIICSTHWSCMMALYIGYEDTSNLLISKHSINNNHITKKKILKCIH